MSDFVYYIPQTIKTKDKVLEFVKEVMFVGNAIEARKQIQKLRKENPDNVYRLNYGTISLYKTYNLWDVQ
jgi:hypothetical protein